MVDRFSSKMDRVKTDIHRIGNEADVLDIRAYILCDDILSIARDTAKPVEGDMCACG